MHQQGIIQELSIDVLERIWARIDLGAALGAAQHLRLFAEALAMIMALPYDHGGAVLAEAVEAAYTTELAWRSEALAVVAAMLPESERGPLLGAAVQALFLPVTASVNLLNTILESVCAGEYTAHESLRRLATKLAACDPSFLFPLWTETLQRLATRPRHDLVQGLEPVVPMIAVLGGSTALLGLAEAVTDVTRSCVLV